MTKKMIKNFQKYCNKKISKILKKINNMEIIIKQNNKNQEI